MPQGNVGTSLNTFTELIRQCKLPSRVIRKLSLEFPKSRTRRRYGAVQMDYGTSSTQSSQGFEVEGAAVTMKHKAEGAVMEAVSTWMGRYKAGVLCLFFFVCLTELWWWC